MSADKSARIAELNDQLRSSLSPKYGRVVGTSGVLNTGDDFWRQCLDAVRTFSEFTDANDPYHEHDFGRVFVEGTKVFWKIDYYERGTDFAQGAEDPSDPKTTDRVMTIMLAEEY
ncbi:MAG: DUF3768 domain-containing protein [Hyphomicrobiaceae bacterium]